MQSTELLAPAGNGISLHAAVRAGADAVYLGLKSFNARRGADNFSFDELCDACDWAHVRGVRVYVALNTLVLPDEVHDALKCAQQAYWAGADALIVQDIGLAREVARRFPEMRLHISTQMNIHNASGIRAASALGAKRVTLARELSLEEIAYLCELAADEGIELETFCHGALCVCYSGQCLLSSMIGGRSANRGMCAQACRLPYTLCNTDAGRDLSAPGNHLLSPRDLCAIDMLAQLVGAGVSSLKIEGRVKSPDYVFAVTSVYRAVLDRIFAGEEQKGATPQEKRALEEAFSRGFTTAYLEGNRGNAIMSYQRPNNRGALLGRVESCNDGVVVIGGMRAHISPPALGDVLEFWTSRGHVTQTVESVTLNGKENVSVPLSPQIRGVHAGDRVFRVRLADAAFSDDPLSPRVGVLGSVRIKRGQPLSASFRLRSAEASRDSHGNACVRACASACGSAEGACVELARTKPITKDEVYEHIARMGTTPFELASLDIELDEGVGLGFSALHKVRAEALENLQTALLEPYRRRNALGGEKPFGAFDAQGATEAKTSFDKPDAQSDKDGGSSSDRFDSTGSLEFLKRTHARTSKNRSRKDTVSVAAWVTNPSCARAARRAGANSLFVPALNYGRGQAVVAGRLVDSPEQAGYPTQCQIALPAINHDACGSSRESLLDFDAWEFVRVDRPVFVESIGSLRRAVEEGLLFEVGPHLPVTNALSLDMLAHLGATRVWLTGELTLEQISVLAKQSTVELGLFIYGAQELMISEHCMLMSQCLCNEECKRCPRRKHRHVLRDRKDYEFPVVSDMLGRSHLYNSVVFDAVGALKDLLDAGVTSFMVDTTLLNVEQAAQATGRVVSALKSVCAGGASVTRAPGATTGHLYRGVS